MSEVFLIILLFRVLSHDNDFGIKLFLIQNLFKTLSD